jgi:hypothetical protein
MNRERKCRDEEHKLDRAEMVRRVGCMLWQRSWRDKKMQNREARGIFG